MINIAVLMGRLTADPELRSTNQGVSVTRFTLAVDKRAGAGEEREANFISIVAWRQTAEFICNYFHKGSMIALKGPIDTNKYVDRDGNKRTSFEIIANEVSFCGDKARQGNNIQNTKSNVQGAKKARNSPTNAQQPRSQSNYNRQNYRAQNQAQDDYNNSQDDYGFWPEEPPAGY